MCRKVPQKDHFRSSEVTVLHYHDITQDDMKNGDGLRTVLWVSGCIHKCEGCQNPVTWDPEDGLVFDEKAHAELFSYLKKDYISGLTVTGGDPLYPGNIPFMTSLLSEVKKQFPEKTVWLYTGEIWENIQNLGLLVDVDVLVDGPFVLAEKDNNLHWKGSKNQRVIDVKRTLMSGEVVLWES